MTELPSLTPALAEIWLAIAGMALLMYGVFAKGNVTRNTSYLTVIALAIAAGLVMYTGTDGAETTFNGLFVDDPFGRFMKLLVLVAAAIAVMMSLSYILKEDMDRFEYPVLFLFATLGMMLMVSADDLISLYIGLELQSLSLYVVAAFRRDTLKSSEAGLKYFVLGALSSGLLLYGCSLIYGFAGTTSFADLAALFAETGSDVALGLVVGIVFVCAGMAFKVSAVPFHMWTPDVYEGAPTSVTAFFAVAPKIAAMTLFIRLLMEPFGDLVDQWQQIIILISALSMVLGAFAALNQRNIKRLMAYSSIGHMGYALVGLAAGSEAGIRGVIVYLAIYLAMNMGAFAAILCMRINNRAVEQIDDLAGLWKTNPLMALTLGALMFSLAGIPPLAGFFGKLFVFQAAIEAQLHLLAIIGVLASVVGAFYYLRIIKLMYFDEPVESFDPVGRDMAVVMGASGLFTVLFILMPAPLIDAAGRAAQSLIGG